MRVDVWFGAFTHWTARARCLTVEPVKLNELPGRSELTGWDEAGDRAVVNDHDPTGSGDDYPLAAFLSDGAEGTSVVSLVGRLVSRP